MPLLLDPDRDRFWASLASDAAKPEAERPAFCFRALSCRAWRDLDERYERVREAKTGRDAMDIVLGCLAGVVVGWRNVPGEFGEGSLADVLTLNEAHELVGLALQGQRPDAETAKKSESP